MILNTSTRDADFWTLYNNFFPAWQPIRFGDEFLSNHTGDSATLQGELGPVLNQQIAMTGAEQFPVQQIKDLASIITPATGPTQGAIDAVNQNNRFGDWSKKAGVGILGIVLIAVGIIYLGLVAYQKSTGSSSIPDAIKKTAEAAA
jgi:hypothetical protein